MNLKGILLLILWNIFVYLAYPGGPFPLLAWISFVPFGLAVSTFNKRQALVYSTIFSFLTWFTTIWCLALGLVNISHLDPLKWWIVGMFPILVFCVPYIIFCYLAQKFKLFDPANSNPIAAAALLTLLIVYLPNPFPNHIALSLFRETKFIQICDIGGTTLLLFIVNTVNFLFSSAILALPDYIMFLRRGISALLILFSLCLYGDYQIEKWDSVIANAEKFKIGIVQPNMNAVRPNYSKEALAQARMIDWLDMLNQMQALNEKDKDIELFVSPEIPINLELLSDNPLAQKLDAYLKKIQKPILINASYLRNIPNKSISLHNSIHIVTDNISNFQTYLKNKLVPFGEYNPFENLIYIFTGKRPFTFTKWNEVNILKVGEHAQIASPICLEGAFPEFIARFVKLGANIIINPADDFYFGNTRCAELHMAASSFRAVEFRIPMVRAANSGITQVFDQAGRTQIKDESLFAKNSWVKEISLTPSFRETDPNLIGSLITLGFLLTCILIHFYYPHP